MRIRGRLALGVAAGPQTPRFFNLEVDNDAELLFFESAVANNNAELFMSENADTDGIADITLTAKTPCRRSRRRISDASLAYNSFPAPRHLPYIPYSE